MIKMVGSHLRKKKGFTLIELIVVIAVLAILVLLALPSFIGQVDKAKLSQIKHDVKVAETITAEHLITSGSLEDWGTELSSLPEGEAYNKRGVIGTLNPVKDGPYWKIPSKAREKINSKLNGSFYSNNNGDAYYIENSNSSNEELTDEEIDDYVNNLNYIPVATAQELQQINGSGFDEDNQPIFEELTWGAGTKWEGKYTGTLSSDYIVVQDLDLSEYPEWEPIGPNPGIPFSGNFNGGHFAINNLSITNDSEIEFPGLFGSVIADEAIVMNNVNLINTKVGKNSDYAGALISFYGANGNGVLTLEDIQVVDSDVSGGNYSGGLIGITTGTIDKVINSNVVGNINGRSDAGGLIGMISSSNIPITFNGASFKGTIYAPSSAGGVIGNNTVKIASISDVSIDANISSNSYSGGIIGQNNNGGSDFFIDDAVIQGSIEVKEYTKYIRAAGGLVGVNNRSIASITNIKVESDITSSGVSAGLIGQNNGYESALIMNTVLINGDIYGVDSTAGLIAKTSGPIKTIKNITVNSNIISENDVAGGLFGAFSSSGVITTINTIDISGTIDGYKGAAGLIASNYGSFDTISEITVDATVEGGNGSEYAGDVGGLFGAYHSSHQIHEIKDVSVQGMIIGYKKVGGLIGANTSIVDTIENVTIDADITGKGDGNNSYVGGLLGYNTANTTDESPIHIEDIDVNGSLSGKNIVGGVIGFNTSQLNDLNNINVQVDIKDGIQIGGLIGYTTDAKYIKLSDSSIMGTLNSSSNDARVGGLYGISTNRDIIIQNTTIDFIHKNTSGYSGGLIGERKRYYETNIDDVVVLSDLVDTPIHGKYIGLYELFEEAQEDLFDFTGITFSGSARDDAGSIGQIEIVK